MSETKDYFDYRGTRIAYLRLGEGKPLVVLHGWGSSSRVMLPPVKMLAHLRTCYVPDLPGFGDSDDPPEPWNIDNYADMAQAFIEQLDHPKIDLLVHSFGGRITLKLLSRSGIRDRIDKVLITGGAGMKPKRSPTFYFKKYLAKILKAPFMILPAGLRESSLNRLRETALWKSLGSSDYRKLSGVMRETFVKSVTEHLDSLLPEIDHEILLLWGENDDATPLYQGQRMEKGLKNSALVVIDGAGHYSFLDKPKRFAVIAEAFFKG